VNAGRAFLVDAGQHAFLYSGPLVPNVSRTDMISSEPGQPEFHLITPHLKHLDPDVISDDDFFPSLATEN
jgi:hypothetical protein